MITDIEFVCSGNNGRSPLAEAYASSFARVLGLNQTLGLKYNIHISSSGTLVEQHGDLKKTLEPIVNKAIRKNILAPLALDTLEYNPNLVLETLIADEAKMRDEYLQNSGIYIKNDRTQTIIRPEAQLILPMDLNNFERVVRLYDGSEYNPEIITLGTFSGLKYTLEQDYPSTKDEYTNIAAQIETATKAAMIKISKMH